jgi:hypothetical protein
LVNAANRDRDLQFLRIVFVRDDRVQAQAAETRRPLFAVRVVPEAAVQRPGFAVVARFKKRGRSDAAIHPAVGTYLDVPDIFERFFRIFGKFYPHFLGRVPGFTEIVASAKFGAEMPACRRGPQELPTVPVVHRHRIYRPAREMRPRHAPIAVCAAPV